MRCDAAVKLMCGSVSAASAAHVDSQSSFSALGVRRLADLVARALKLLVERDGPFYLTVWNGLTTIQQRVLTAAVKENGTALASQAVTERYGVSASTMSKALKFLENREVLRREELHNSMRWRLEDPFFAAWLDR
jgi:hypothetical protein